MKYLLLILSILLITYPVYGLVSCLQAVGHLSNYGMGVLSGCLLLMTLGISLLFFTIKLFKRKTHTSK